MPAFFLDSSSVVKRFAKETGTNWIFSLVRPSAQNRLYLARITGVEVIAAITKRKRVGSINSNAGAKAIRRFERDFQNRYLLIDVSPQIIQRAMDLAKSHTLRGYDAVQLASALEANRERTTLGGTPLTFISADKDLNTAATSEGLTVDDPNNH